MTINEKRIVVLLNRCIWFGVVLVNIPCWSELVWGRHLPKINMKDMWLRRLEPDPR
jgi:hypothetical protein